MMGEMKFFLRLEVHQSPRGIFINQSQYTMELLKKHGMEKCDAISTPMVTARIDPDLQGTPTNQTKYRSMIGGLMCLTDSGFELVAYADVDHAGCHDNCKSTSGGIQFMGDKLVSWSSKKQDCIAMSTAEAKYVSLYACCAQVIWMRTQLLDYGYRYFIIPMYCDSKSAIAISCNAVQHSRTKHINIRHHFIKKHVEQGGEKGKKTEDIKGFKMLIKFFIYVVPFPEEDLEENMNPWVKKEFKTFNEEARLSNQHWEDSWHK
nr:retrovirus-related Pol polyprotein from transposon TNT 1-94 [Tanacetum cinerariifolium]